ncbi:Abortive infection protein AbiEi [Alkalibacterium sp. s-m-22]|uniref:Abortive infection protein AbiEi n=1 Tax=Alkalibacterium indicireducens TaxID=398758 RepID=A0ABP3KS11_9LACT
MSQKDKLLKLADENNGILLSKQVTEQGFSRSTIKSLVCDGLLEPIQRGIYVTKNGYADDFFLLGQKFKNGIFSHETALYLLGFSDRTPIQITMTFEHGNSTTRIKNEGVRPVMISNDFLLGRTTIVRNGLTIRVYSIERTLVDLLKPRYEADYEQLIPALKQYAAYDKKDVNKLFRYARQFGVEKQIRNYMGVLL